MSVEEPRVRLCKGDCNRMTRPRNSKPIAGVETIPRQSGRYCSSCYPRFATVAEARKLREMEARDREKEISLRAAFKAREDLLAIRRRRQEEKDRQAKAVAAFQKQLREKRKASV